MGGLPERRSFMRSMQAWPKMIVSLPTPSQTQSGPRPINPGRDIPQVLRLLELVFGAAMDEEGRRAFVGTQMNPPAFLWRFNPIASRLALGFVWEQDGMVVGNVTLLTTKHPKRYLIVNVAVHPDYRRQGIAHELMLYVAARVTERGGNQILLQVEKDNEPALELYKTLDYDLLGTMTAWYSSVARLRVVETAANPPIRKLRGKEWQAAFRLDQMSLHPDLNWPELPDPNLYRSSWLRDLGDAINGRRAETWVAANGRNQLTGLAHIASEWSRTHLIWLRVHPSWRGQLERPLMAHLTHELKYYPRRNIRIDHPDEDDVMGQLLREANFQPRRSLTHMRLDL